MRLTPEREKEIRDPHSVVRDGIQSCSGCEGKVVVKELLLEIDALRESLECRSKALKHSIEAK